MSYTIQITGMVTTIVFLNLNKYATFSVELLNDKNVIVKKVITLSGDDYTNWGNDDSYITNYVSKNIGYDQTSSNTYTIPISGMTVVLASLNLNTSATFNVELLNDKNVTIRKVITLSGDDYTNWGNDDSYITNYAAKNIGYTHSE